MTGRPSSFTQEVADAICEAIEGGSTIREICAREGMPAWPTIRRWLRADESFRTRYAHAREASAEVFEDMMLTAAQTATAENFQVARVQVDTLKWVMSKRAPKVYGDKQQIEAKVDATINVITGVPRA